MAPDTNITEHKTYPLNQLYFYLTEGCNLRCRHCWIAPKYQQDGHSGHALPKQLFQSIVEQGKPLGLSGVKLTGGEPLLHPEINEILDYLKGEDLNVTIETNGVLCTREIAQKIASCKNPCVAVSLDSEARETHEWIRGVPGCFDSAIQGIQNLVHSGIRCQIIMTIMRCNSKGVESMVRLAESLGVESVKFNITMPVARGEALHRHGETLTIKELVELGTWFENGFSASSRLGIFLDHPVAFRPLGRMFGPVGDGCSTCSILGILGVLANGSYALCGIGENVPELIFGHAAHDHLSHVWLRTEVLSELCSGLTHRLKGVCGDCLMKHLCLGSCIAQNYYREKDLWAPFWYCEEARRAGLFPQTRLKPG